jgi:HSP20 family protein
MTTDGEPTTNIQPAQPAKSRAIGFPDLREEMDRLWEIVMTPTRPFSFFSRTRPIPATDVYEKDGELHVRAELPGLTEKDVEVTAEPECLTISGEKRDQSEVKEENYFRSERTYGSFTRQVALPANADIGNVTAKFKDGVLEVSMPLKPSAEKKRIEITPSA